MSTSDSSIDPQTTVDLALPIRQIRVSVRLRNLMARAGIDTLGDLLAFADGDLMQIRNFGVGMLAEVSDLRKHAARGLIPQRDLTLDEVPSLKDGGWIPRRAFVADHVLAVLVDKPGTPMRLVDVVTAVRKPGVPSFTESSIRTALEDLVQDPVHAVQKVGKKFAFLPEGTEVVAVIPERAAGVIELRRQGKTLQEIADVYSVTRERVRQLLVKYGGPSSAEVRAGREERKAQDERDRADEALSIIRAWVDSHGPTAAADIAASTGLSESEVRAFWPEDLRALLLHPWHKSSARWADEAVLGAIRLAGTFEFPLRMSTYDELVRMGEVNGPTSIRVTQRFGTWTEACGLAGVEAPVPLRTDYQSTWTDDDLLGFVVEYLLSRGATGTYAGFEEWRRACGGLPSSQTVRNRFGSWTEIKVRALAWAADQSGETDG